MNSGIENSAALNHIHVNPTLRLNPLRIPSVLDHVLSFLNTSQLKSCRFVCQQWNEGAAKLLFLKSYICLCSSEAILYYLNFFEKRKSSETYSIKFGKQINLGTESVQLFLNQYGSKIKSVYFQESSWTAKIFRKILFEKLSNLEELALITKGTVENMQFFDVGETIPQIASVKVLILDPKLMDLKSLFYPQLLMALPCVETVKRAGHNGSKNADIFVSPDGHFSLLNHILQEGVNAFSDGALNQVPFWKTDLLLSQVLFRGNSHMWMNLKRLEVHIVADNNFMGIMEQRTLHLTYLDIGLPNWGSLIALNSLLNKMGDTLVTLKFTDYDFLENKTNQTFPCLKALVKLCHLYLTGYNGSLSFLSDIPQLKSLTLDRMNWIWLMPPKRLQLVQRHSLENLSVHCTPTYSTANTSPSAVSDVCGDSKVQILTLLAKFFPKLKKLELQNLSDVMLRSVYSLWPHIEELKLTAGRFTDYGIAGWSSTWNGNEGGSDDCTEEQSHIGQLKCLLKLTIQSAQISDVSFLKGVVHCKTLRELNIDAINITEKSLNTILNEMEHVTSLQVANHQFSQDAVLKALNNMGPRHINFAG